jgi:(p)ppGpp synthase/HD superfamily hydrolase
MKVILARWFARWAHRKQVRKYTGEPYVRHCEEVARIVSTVPHDKYMLCAALLHDTVEDTWVKPWLVKLLFGSQVTSLVSDLTDVSTPLNGNRAARKAVDCAHSAAAEPRAQTIKLADLLSNTASITQHDPEFAKTYMAEKERLLEVLTKGDKVLYARCQRALRAYRRKKL